jgi:5'-phosphate synthase pdxT subunit
MKIGILAVQGAFAEHKKMLAKIGVPSMEIRQRKDLNTSLDGIILPGGESTVMGKLLHEFDLFDEIKEMIKSGIPVLGTCAGLILLAEQIENEDTKHFATLPVTVRRNAYGRQLGSFQRIGKVHGIGSFPMTFIRAPSIVNCGDREVKTLAKADGKIVAVKYRNQIGLCFHPEVTFDTKIHEEFVKLC